MQNDDLKKPRAPPPCSRKTTPTQYALAYSMYFVYLTVVVLAMLNVCLEDCDHRAFVSLEDDDLARTVGAQHVDGWRKKV